MPALLERPTRALVDDSVETPKDSLTPCDVHLLSLVACWRDRDRVATLLSVPRDALDERLDCVCAKLAANTDRDAIALGYAHGFLSVT